MSEVAIALFMALVLVLGETRKQLRKGLERLSPRRTKALFGLVLALLPMKLGTYIAAPTSGTFEVCYRLYDDPDDVPCSPTFEASPWLAARSEHFDQRSSVVPVLNFQSKAVDGRQGFSLSNWNNPTINSFAFDGGWWMWNGKDNNIEFFPFRATFSADISTRTNDDLKVSYVGEGTLKVGDITAALPASYSTSREIIVSLPAGSQQLTLDFFFKRTQKYESADALPYAALRVENVGISQALLRASTPVWVTSTNTISDFAVLAIALIGLFYLARSLRRVVGGLFVGLLIGLVSAAMNLVVPTQLLLIEAHILCLLAATIWVLWRSHSLAYLVPTYIFTSWVLVNDEIRAAIGVTPGFDHVLVRMRGNDHLVYHALSRLMLEDGWLRGAEDIFYFQPGIRYYFYWLGIIFGDSGFLTGLISVVVMAGSILYFLRAVELHESRIIRLLQFTGSAGLIVWWTSSHTIQSTIFGLSEFGTWPLLLFMSGIVMQKLRWYHFATLGAMAAAVTWIRPNQGLAALFLLILAYYRSEFRGRVRFRYGITMFVTWFGLLLLIPIHNVVFSSSLVFQPIGARVAIQQPWLTIVRSIWTADARPFATEQLRGLLYLPSVLPDIRSPALGLAFPLFALIFAAGIVVSLRHGRKVWILVVLSSAVVVGQIVPYFKYTILRYYPIMLDAIYLSAFVMGMLLLQATLSSGRFIREKENPSTSESTIQNNAVAVGPRA